MKIIVKVYRISCLLKYQFLHLDACADYECSNGGTCVLDNESPKCDCLSGFLGVHCEKKGIKGETKKIDYYRMSFDKLIIFF